MSRPYASAVPPSSPLTARNGAYTPGMKEVINVAGIDPEHITIRKTFDRIMVKGEDPVTGRRIHQTWTAWGLASLDVEAHHYHGLLTLEFKEKQDASSLIPIQRVGGPNPLGAGSVDGEELRD